MTTLPERLNGKATQHMRLRKGSRVQLILPAELSHMQALQVRDYLRMVKPQWIARYLSEGADVEARVATSDISHIIYDSEKPDASLVVFNGQSSIDPMPLRDCGFMDGDHRMRKQQVYNEASQAL